MKMHRQEQLLQAETPQNHDYYIVCLKPGAHDATFAGRFISDIIKLFCRTW